MRKNFFVQRLSLCFLLLFITIINAKAQYAVNGPSCVVPDFNYGGYQASGGSTGTGDKWCVTGGTINGTGNTCITNTTNGGSTISVKWNPGITTGYVSYYQSSNNSSPSATMTVTIVNNTISTIIGPYLYVPLNKSTIFTLTGSDGSNVCSSIYAYYWQRSTDGFNYTNIDFANGKDYLNAEVFTQPVYFRRQFILNNIQHFSIPVTIQPFQTATAGGISPTYSIVKAGTSALPLTASAASGGTMCGPGSYTYQWETSTDNVTWTVQSTAATSFSPGVILQKTYVRQKVFCGPVADISNVAVIDIYKALEAGTIAPDNKIIPINTDPGIFTGNPARYGNNGSYTYQWQKCSSPDFSTGVTDIVGTNSLTYNPGNFTSTGITYFRRKVTCDGVTVYSNIVSIVAGTPSTDQNYIRSRTVIKPAVTTKTGADALTSTQDVKESTQYLDGLGRLNQTVIKQGSLNSAAGNTVAYDLVKPSGYDNRGREAIKYLSYPSATATDGLYKTNVFNEQYAFNNTLFSGENYYYNLVTFESTPDSKIKSIMPEGMDWIGANTGIDKIYFTNLFADSIRVWNVGENPGDFGYYSSTSIYPAGALYKAITVDENGKQVIEFKNKDGLVILKKVQLKSDQEYGAGSGYSGWLSTYYLYDIFNNLRAVIQPAGVNYLSQNNWSLSGQAGADILEGQFFRYEYDQRNRMIMKKMPGAGAIYMVYDNRDRLVMTQDANMRALDKWVVTLYENELNRPFQTGLVLNTAISNPARSFSDHKTQAGASVAYPFSVAPGSGWELLTETHYDDYTGVSGSLAGTFDNSWSSYFNTNQNTFPYPQPQTAVTGLKGIQTYIKTSVLGMAGIYLYNVNIYDQEGRIIQTKSTNITFGTDVFTMQYNFAGQPLTTVTKQQAAMGGNQTSVTVTNLTYDILGRLSKTEKRISLSSIAPPGDVMGPPKVINEVTYDALGQIQNKSFGRKRNIDGTLSATAPLAKLAYDYNIRGWLLSINKSYILQNTNDDRYFALNLSYNKLIEAPPGAPSYPFSLYKNGNISSVIWRSAGDGLNRRYNFLYDNVNRLLVSDFAQQNGSGWNTSDGINFSTKMGVGWGDPLTSYDANGNILQMQQTGATLLGSQVIDDLKYTYYPQSNRLKNVRDANNDVNSKLGDFKTLASHPQSAAKAVATDLTTITDYEYDFNGNLKKDYNKGIGDLSTDGIVYNHLNLPQTVTFPGKGSIGYIYDAFGNKLKKTVTEGPNTTATFYLNGATYEQKNNGALSLQFIAHEEGRIRTLYDNAGSPTTPTDFAYDYFLKDHLGNVRMVLTDEYKVKYYPAATLEGDNITPQANSMINYEKQFYNIDNSKVIDENSVPSWPVESIANGKLYYNNNGNPPANLSYPPGAIPTQTDGSGKLYQLNATANKTGLEFVIKVMAGDKIDIFGKSYYVNTTQITNGNSTTLDLLGLMTNLLTAPGNAAAAKGFTASQLNSVNTSLVPSSFFRGSNNESSTTVPKAYINYIFFDEQFKYAGGGFSRVGPNSGQVKDHWYQDAGLQNITVPKNGYIFVYVSNESNFQVFFDNLQVIHKPGPILEETHYYPFGLTMAGISSKALNNSPENKYKYNKGSELQNKEFNDGSGLELYSTALRSLDPQLGRWWQLDPKPGLGESPYASMGNNPILRNDPLGDTAVYFRPDGSFWKFVDDGKKKFTGVFFQKSAITSTYEKDGEKYQVTTYSQGIKFKFNDPKNDVQAIKNGVINRVQILTKADIEKQVDRSGVNSSAAQKSPYSYANDNSTAGGKMDYAVKGALAGDLKKNTFYLYNSNPSGAINNYIGYNIADIGNFMWGWGIATLGIGNETAAAGAEYNHIFHARRGKDKTDLFDFGPGTYGPPGWFDSSDDQQAIQNGWNASPRGWSMTLDVILGSK
jgi:RHS repeat-associated protein